MQHLGNEFKVGDAITDRERGESGIDDTGELDTFHLTMRGFVEEILVKSKDDPIENQGAVEQVRICKSRRAVFLGGEDIYAAQAQT